jgi:membrane protease YdiL (CAAX protease family)
VLTVAFASYIHSSFDILLGVSTLPVQPGIGIRSVPSLLYSILKDAGTLALLWYVLRRSQRFFRDLGLCWTSRDVAIALPLTIGALLAFRFSQAITFSFVNSYSGHFPQVADLGGLIYGASTSMANVLDEFVNGFFEELIVRGYLMTEIKRLTGSIFFAVLCSVGVQISYHFYQGGPLAISHIGTFMLFAVFYAKTNRILPPILAHSAIDLNSFLNYALRNT